MKIESVNIMEVTINERTIQFRENDIVEVVYSLDKTCTGRITFIDTTDFEIDASKEYKSDVRNIKYNDIELITLIKRQ